MGVGKLIIISMTVSGIKADANDRIKRSKNQHTESRKQRNHAAALATQLTGKAGERHVITITPVAHLR